MKETPVPIGPSRLEFHVKERSEREPSSGSSADPEKVMIWSVRKVSPSPGLSMDAVGGELIEGALTVMATEALPVAPRLSVAVKVMVWLPALREALKDVPVPIVPATLDVHTSEAPTRAPSSSSFPEPLKVMVSPVRKLALFAGLLMDAVGGALAESTVREYVRERKRELGVVVREAFVPQDYRPGEEGQAD